MLGEGFRALARNISKKVGDKKDKLRNYQVRDFIKDRKVDKKEEALKNMGVKNAEEVAEKGKSFNHKRIEFLKNKLKLEIASDRFKVLTLYVTSFIVDTIQAVIKMLIILLSNIYIVILLGAVVVVIALFSALAVVEDNKANKPEQPQVSDQINQGQQGGSGASWTLEELAIRGSLLSDYEKNLYRMIMLCKQTADGSLTGEKLGSNPEASMVFLLGLSSIETSMQFYSKLHNSTNILETPSDKVENSKGYGVCGLHYTDILSKYYKSESVEKIKSIYKPKTQPAYEIRYYPYAVPMSSKHLDDKMKDYVYIKETQDKIEAVMNDFGITENRDELKTIIEWCLGQAQYHGALKSEHEAYITFLCAMWQASSDDPSSRRMTNYTYKSASYSESSIRHTFTGIYHYIDHTGKTYNHIIQAGNPSNIRLCPKCSSRILLNGKELEKPMWAFLWDKFGNSGDPKIKKRMDAMWDEVAQICSYTGGAKDRILNFHYGINAYIQGSTIVNNISGKLTGTPSNNTDIVAGSFKPTKGKGQGVWEGKSVETIINDYLKSHPSASSFLNGLKPHFGTAKNATPNTSVAGVVWKPIKFKVPFYGQGSRFGESYGTLKYHPNGDTFNYSGCMVYAHAYAMSAMTGRLINPAELSAMMYMGGYFNGSGLIYGSKMPSLYKKLGLNAEVLPDLNGSNWKSNWSKVDACLDKGGVAVVRATGSPYASGSNHYLVITSRVDGGSEKMYSMYTSTNVPQTNGLHSESTLKANLHREITLVWK